MLCCRVPSTLRPLLNNAGAPKDELYSEDQMRGVLSAYAAANALELGDSSIKLDKLMVSNLFNKKEPQLEGDSCPVEDVVRRLLGKLQLFHQVTRVTEQVQLSAARPNNGHIHSSRKNTPADLFLSCNPVSITMVMLFAAESRNISADISPVRFGLPCLHAIGFFASCV